MIEFMRIWCEEIIVSVIVAIIIEMFVPQGNIKKYVRVVIGIYIMFVILNPIVSNIDKVQIESIAVSNKYSNLIHESNIQEWSNIYARALENEIESKFSYISDVRIVLTDELEDIERIEITLGEEVSSLDELRNTGKLLYINFSHKGLTSIKQRFFWIETLINSMEWGSINFWMVW